MTPSADSHPLVDDEALRRRLVALARHWLAHGDEAEDLVQDTWLRTAQGRLPPDASGREAWLVTVLRHLCIDAWRRHQRHHALLEQAGEDGVPALESEAPQDMAEQAQRVEQALRHVVRTLPAAQAAAASADGSLSRALETGSADYLQARQSAAAVLRMLAPSPNPKRRLEAGKELTGGRRGGKSSAAADRETLTRRLRALGTLFRDLHVVSSRGEPAWLSNTDLADELNELARSYAGDRARRGYASVDRAVQALARNASPKVVVDWLTLQF